MVLYPPPSTSPRRALTSPTPPPRRQREKSLALTQVEWEDTTPDSPPSATRNPTSTSPPPPPKTENQRALPVTRVEWDNTSEPIIEDVTIRQKTSRTSVASPHQSPRSTKQHPSRVRQQWTNQTEGATPTVAGSQDPPKKKRRLNRETTTNTEGTQQLEASRGPILSTTITQVGTSSLIGKIEHGQTTQISEDEVLGYKDLPVEAYEFSALLRLGTTYELMDFIVRAQVAAAARMAEEHTETKMI